MESPLNVTEKILPLIAVTINLADGARVVDKTVPADCEAADDGLKILGENLKVLEKMVLRVSANLGGLGNENKDRKFKKLLRDRDGQKAVKDLRSALNETFDCLKQLAAGAEDDHSQLRELSYNDRSLMSIQASLQHSLAPSKVDDAVSSLRSMHSDIKRYTEKIEDAFMRTTKLYSLISNQKPSIFAHDSPRSSAMMAIRHKLIRLLKPRKSKTSGTGDEDVNRDGVSSSAIELEIKEAQTSASPDGSASNLLLQLPPELLILIITALDDDFLQDLPRARTDTLPALRLTCKTLAILCAPFLFRSIGLREADSERQYRLAENARELGVFVHELTFILARGSTDDEIFQVYYMLSQMPNVRTINVSHEREDISSHTAFLTIIDKFSHLESITLLEKNYHPAYNYLPYRNVEISHTFFHRFLHKAVDVHGHRLKHLSLRALLPLNEDLYIKIRDLTPNLRSIALSGNIGVELRDQFSEPVLWASGRTGSLESINLHNCAGVHASNFTRNVLFGAYGSHLKLIRLVACGYSQTDIPSVPAASIPAQARVDHLHLDHMSGWELEALSRIPVQDLSLTRLLPDDILQLPALLVSGFAGMGSMSMNPKMGVPEAWGKISKASGDAYKEIQDRCAQRKIKMNFDAFAWPNACNAHVHI